MQQTQNKNKKGVSQIVRNSFFFGYKVWLYKALSPAYWAFNIFLAHVS